MNTFRCVVFTLSGHKFSLPLECVERVVRAVEVTPLIDAPPTVMGVINVQGQIVPVVDARRHLSGSFATELELNDQLIIARNGEDLVAIVANTVDGVAEFDSKQVVASETLPGVAAGNEFLHGIIATGNDLIMMRHPSHFVHATGQADLAIALQERKAV